MTLNRCPMLPLKHWPAAEQRRWSEAKARNRPAREGYGTRPTWTADYWEKQEEAYGGWLGWLFFEGQLDPKQQPEQRYTRQRLQAYIDFMLGRVSPATALNRIEHLKRALMVLGAKPDQRSFRDACRHLRRRARATMRRDRPPSDRELEALGRKLMARADSNHDPRPRVNAVIFRDGLLIAALAHHPLRRRNWAELRLEVDLVRRDRDWWILVTVQKAKRRLLRQIRWPADLQAALERYLRFYRPILAGYNTTSDRLWLTYRRKPESRETLSFAVARRTKVEFGRAWRPHAVRRSVASCVDTVTDAAILLGNTPAVIEESYRQARRQVAFQHHLELLRQYQGGHRNS